MSEGVGVRDVTVVVLGKYPDIFEQFRVNAEQYLADYQKVFVRDGHEIPDPPGSTWRVVQGPEMFSMAGNANLGLRAVDPLHDILYLGDDVLQEAPQSIQFLQEDAYSDPKIGILSPMILGGACNALQTTPGLLDLTCTETPLAFICVYIKREVIKLVGYMDEEFNEYGYDDVDYCVRTCRVGYKLAVTPRVRVTHSGGHSQTFARNPSWPVKKNAETFRKKWPDLNL
jgi:hypothetical protein